MRIAGGCPPRGSRFSALAVSRSEAQALAPFPASPHIPGMTGDNGRRALPWGASPRPRPRAGSATNGRGWAERPQLCTRSEARPCSPESGAAIGPRTGDGDSTATPGPCHGAMLPPSDTELCLWGATRACIPRPGHEQGPRQLHVARLQSASQSATWCGCVQRPAHTHRCVMPTANHAIALRTSASNIQHARTL